MQLKPAENKCNSAAETETLRIISRDIKRELPRKTMTYGCAGLYLKLKLKHVEWPFYLVRHCLELSYGLLCLRGIAMHQQGAEFSLQKASKLHMLFDVT